MIATVGRVARTIAVLAVVAGAGAATAVAPGGVAGPLVAVIVCVVLGLVVVATGGPRTACLGAWMLAVGLSAANALRLAEWLAVADIPFLVAILLTFLLPARQRPAVGAVGTLVAGLGLLLVAGLAGALAAGVALESLLNLARLLLVAGAIPVALVRFAPRGGELRGIAWAGVLGATVSAALGLVQFLVDDARPVGLATHFNHLGLASVLGIGAAMGLSGASRRATGLATVAAAIMTGGIFVSGSRAALLGLGVAVLVWLALGRRLRLAAGLALVGGLAIIALAGGLVEVPVDSAVGRFLELDPGEVGGSNAARVALLQAALGLVEASPLFGSGFDHARDAHNVYLQLLVSSGIAGLTGLVVVVLAVVRNGLRIATTPGTTALLAAGLSSGYLGFLVASAFQNALWDRYIWVTPGLLLATAVASRPTGHVPAVASAPASQLSDQPAPGYAAAT